MVVFFQQFFGVIKRINIGYIEVNNDLLLYYFYVFKLSKLYYPWLDKMSVFDWSMTRWYKTHATGW